MIREQLDGVICNDIWRSSFPGAKSIHIPSVSSNHIVVILDTIYDKDTSQDCSYSFQLSFEIIHVNR